MIEKARRSLVCPATDWYPVFLEPKGAEDRWEDWLFFIKRAWTIPRLLGIKFQEEHVPPADLSVICTWWDRTASLPGTPHGLNDCAHFVSECLHAGHIRVADPGVRNLIKNLSQPAEHKDASELG